MSPTVLRSHGFRFHFYAHEEARIHVHVDHGGGVAKFWLEPEVALRHAKGLSEAQCRRAQELIEEHRDDIVAAWRQHFPPGHR